ncbi:MAG: carbon-nitrogen family hydrolase [Acidobacteria bacterium]|nr:carbon-nitrogen family hydrolase [Acidobacteriota bacterium]
MLRSLITRVQLAILPELWTVGFFNFDQYQAVAETIPGPQSEALAAVAREKRMWLHAGSFIERTSEGTLHNSSLLFDPQGRLVSTYRKLHLFGHESDERSLLHPGEAPAIVATPFGIAGLSTCYDLRFPELYRILSRGGAEVFLVSSAWPCTRPEHWLVLNRARAIENLAFVVACNAAGETRGRRLLGSSLVVDPWGVVVARAGEGEEVLHARIDFGLARRVRQQFPALRDRRLG